MKASKYLLELGLDDAHLPLIFNGDDKSYYNIPELMESYHKEASKELVEALKVIVFIKNSIRYFEDYDPILIEAIDQAEEALENHLK